MEKKPKSFAAGVKRQRKMSLRAATSEPKNMIFDISEIPPIELNNANPLKAKPKINIDIPENIIPELTKQDLAPPPPKKKAKQANANFENNEIGRPEAKKQKKGKHDSVILQAKASVVAPHIKKKKKEKDLVTEVHNLKVELGIAKVTKEDNEEKPGEPGEKSPNKTPVAKRAKKDLNANESDNKFPILSDKQLIDKFLKVPMNNNQKGRIRQVIKLSLQGSTTKMFPEIINGKIQAILSSSKDLTDSELRRIRILYNMLKTALDAPDQLQEGIKSPKKKKEKKIKEKDDGDKKAPEQNKVKGPKRYVVFLGNLPLNVDKEKILEHFRELDEQIIDIRLPKRPAGKKTAIAYVELSNEPSFELALSKHHSMLGTKRIKVLYTTQQKGKITKAEAKMKSAKLIALQKAGKLIGSVPAVKKRSHRRAIMKKAKAIEAAAIPAQ